MTERAGLGADSRSIEDATTRHGCSYSLSRRDELAYPTDVFSDWARRSEESLVSGLQFAVKGLRQDKVVRIVDRPLVEPICQFQSSAMRVPKSGHRR